MYRTRPRIPFRAVFYFLGLFVAGVALAAAPVEKKDNSTSSGGTAVAAADSVPAAQPKPQPTPPGAQVEFAPVGFDVLGGFEYPEEGVTSATTKSPIPENIMALNGRKVAIQGFMVPLDVYQEVVHTCLLLKNQSSCCYGIPPRINEVITVKASGAGIPLVMDEPVTVRGILHVGEIRESGSLMGIYILDVQGK